MRKVKNFKQLVNENKQELLQNNKVLSRIEKKVDDKLVKRPIS